MTLDTKGREVTLTPEKITKTYHVADDQPVAPPIQGYVNEGDRKTYSLVDSASISNTVKGDKTKAPVYNGSSTVA